jgi:hypothetical protein
MIVVKIKYILHISNIFRIFVTMYIREVKKNNTPNGKVFLQYQLSETYRVEGTVKQKAILYLGYHNLLENKDNRKIVAKLLEDKIRNEQTLSEVFDNIPEELQQLADEYYRKFLQKIESEEAGPLPEPEDKAIYDEVDISSTQVFDCREIGAEWMSYQMLERIGLREFLSRKGWAEKKINYALISIISRAVAAYSEHKTEGWLELNSGLTELFDKNIGPVSRHNLYKSADNLYGIKDELEEYLYNRMINLFELKDSIIIYDLTNTYFEGRKVNSKIAKYGRSKEKRTDCKQVVLAAVVNEHGFLKHSRVYEGNMSDPETLIEIIGNMKKKDSELEKQPIIVIDAGIATEENLGMLRREGYLYVCVSRSKPKKDFVIDVENTVNITDRRGSEIKLKYVESNDSIDRWLYVKSAAKAQKEDSMLEQALERFEQEMKSVSEGISKKGGTKKAEKVWERIGRIKERNRSAHKYYEITVETKDGTAVKVTCQKKEIEHEDKQSGEYYLRTNYIVEKEEQIWQIYNTIREVESAFRCLKSDLKLRPVHHQKDKYTEAHLHLGLLAYQIVAPIRYMLKSKGINYDWQNIVRIMNTQKVVSVSQNGRNKTEIIVRKCSRPNRQVLEFYQALSMSSMPFGIKKYVVYH